MARIRSVHPDLFLDEAFVLLSPATRIFLIGLWTECDDHGAFEWQPSRLRFKILPADGIPGDELLGELERANVVRKVEIDGRSYGLVRNFCRFQRPKKPKYKVEIPTEHRSFVALKADGSLPSHHHITGLTQQVGDDGNNQPPPVTQSSPTGGEISAQKKEEGGRKKGKESKTTTEKPERVTPTTSEGPPAPPSETLSPALKPFPEEAKEPKPPSLRSLGTELPARWTPDDSTCEACKVDFGMTDDDLRTELPAFHAHNVAAASFSADWSKTFWLWCKRWKEHRDKQPKPRVELSKLPAERFVPTAADWDKAAELYARTGRWPREHGPDPLSPACKCPKDVLERYGVDTATGERRIPPRKAVTA